MAKKIDIHTKIIPSSGRSKRSQNIVGGGYSSSSTSSVVNTGDAVEIMHVDTAAELFSDNNVLSSLRTIKEILARIISDPENATEQNTYSAAKVNAFVEAIDEAIANINKALDNKLSKDKDDSTEFLINFLNGLKIGDKYAIAKDGKAVLSAVEALEAKFNNLSAEKAIAKVATLNDLTAELAKIHGLEVSDTANILKAVVGSISSEKFVSGFAGEGFRIAQAINGDWNLEIDNLIVRKVFQVFELLVQEIKHQGGMVLHSPAGGKITKVTDGGSYWKCEIESADIFFKDDLVICQKFTGTIKRYWRAVTSVGTGYLNLSKTDCEANSAIPQIDDEIAVQGNKTNISRQSVYIINVVGEDAPCTAYYSGINSYSLKDKLVTREGNLNGIIDPDFGALKGYGLYANNAYLKGILRLTNGKTVEQELLSTNNTVEANRLQLGGEIDKAKADAKNAQDSVDNLLIGGRNIIKNGGTARYSDKYLITDYNLSTPLKHGTPVTFVIRCKTYKGDIGIFGNDGNNDQRANIPSEGDEFVTHVKKWNVNVVDRDINNLRLYNIPNTAGQTADIEWACLYIGDVVAPLEFIPSISDQQSELNKQITSVRTDFDVVQGQINMNVAETQRLVSVSNNHVAEATQASNKAQQNADKAKTEADKAKQAKEASEGILQSVTTKEANINVVAGEVNIKAKEATESATRAVNAEASINTKADGIVMEASRQSAQKAIDGLEIGGSNIIKNGDTPRYSDKYLITDYNLSTPLKHGTPVTFVIRCKTYKGDIGIFGNDGNNDQRANIPSEGDEFVTHVKKWNVNVVDRDINNLRLYNIPNTAGQTADIEWACLYIGDVKAPLDFIPSKMDIDQQFQATKARFELLDNQISAEVSKTDGIRTDLTTLSQDHDSFKVQVKTDIDGAIDSNNEVIKSSFTMNGNKIGLLGSEIDITGKVKFSALDSETQETLYVTVAKVDGLGDLAYADKVEKAKLGSTIIEGGFIKTELIKTDELVSKKVKTANSGPRFEMEGSEMKVYGDGVHPNMIFGVNKDGYAVMEYYTPTGEKLYDLGPSGINILNFAPVKWTEKKLKQFSTEKSRENITSQDFAKIVFGNVTQTNSPIYYTYYAGGNPTVSQEEREREKYTYDSINGPKIADGWYYFPPYANDRDYRIYPSNNSGNLIKPEAGGLYSDSYGIVDRDNIYIVKCYLYVGGVITDSANYYFQENPKNNGGGMPTPDR